MSDLSAPITALKGVGEALALKLGRLGIERVSDLLFHLPLRYQDRTRLTPIGLLRAGQEAVIEGEVTACDVVKGRRRSLLVRLRDASGILSLRFFTSRLPSSNSCVLAPPCERLVKRGPVRPV